MTQHTPGPWQIACDSYGKVRHSRKACVYTSNGNGGLEDIAKAVANWDDARLIAAAPDLLAALQRIAAGEVMSGDYSHADTVLAYQKIARAAIAKAEGRHD